MSAIGGLLNLDGRPVDAADLAALSRISRQMAERGPDRAGDWHAGPVGFIHRLLQITPESLAEQQPLAGDAGALVINADARLDNRADLCTGLGRRDDGQPDCALILAAYEKWGEACVERLLGDFAFAIWDARQRSLFCARDHMGVRPFAYFHGPRLFAFASEVNALLVLPQIPRAANEVRVAGFLTTSPDPDHSFYRDIHYLPPGHTLTASRQAQGLGVKLRQYWDLEAPRETRLPNDAAYAEAFRGLLTEAVTCRLRSAYPVGVMLSGGLDSSSVACLAGARLAEHGQRLHTLSNVYDEAPSADEREFIAPVLEAIDGGLGPAGFHYEVLGDPVSMVTRVEDLTAIIGEPFFGMVLPLQWVSNDVARQHGVRVLLDGIYGDTVISQGDLRLAELVGAGHWRTAAREAALLSAGWPNPARGARQFLWYFGFRPWVPAPLRRRLRDLRDGPRHDSYLDAGRPDWARGSLIQPSFARRLDREARLRELGQGRMRTYTTEQDYVRYGVGRYRHQFGPFNQLAARSLIEQRHPFADRRIVEFCLGLPADQRLRDGWTRFIERQAMTGILPQAVRRRRHKTTSMPAASRSLLARDLPELDRLLGGIEDSPAAEWVDLPALELDLSKLRRAAARGEYENSSHREQMARLWRVLTLQLWVRQAELVPDALPAAAPPMTAGSGG